MTFKEKREKEDVVYNLNLIKQLRKLTKEETVIERHLKGNVSILPMCEKFWQIGIDERKKKSATMKNKVMRIKLKGQDAMRFEEINGEIYVGPKELQNSIKCLVPELQQRIEKVFYSF